MTVRDTGNNNDSPAIVGPTWLEFQITDTKICVPVVTLSLLLQQLKSWFKRTIKWDKYRSQMTVQSNTNNLNYLTDSTFTKVNRLFVLSCARNARGNHRDFFSNYYVPNVESKIPMFWLLEKVYMTYQ